MKVILTDKDGAAYETRNAEVVLTCRLIIVALEQRQLVLTAVLVAFVNMESKRKCVIVAFTTTSGSISIRFGYAMNVIRNISLMNRVRSNK